MWRGCTGSGRGTEANLLSPLSENKFGYQRVQRRLRVGELGEMREDRLSHHRWRESRRPQARVLGFVCCLWSVRVVVVSVFGAPCRCWLRAAGCGLAIFWRRQCGWWHANSDELLLKVESGGETQRPTAGPKTRVCALNFFSAGSGAVTAPLVSGWRTIRSQTSLSVSLAVEYFFAIRIQDDLTWPTPIRHLCLLTPHSKEQK